MKRIACMLIVVCLTAIVAWVGGFETIRTFVNAQIPLFLWGFAVGVALILLIWWKEGRAATIQHRRHMANEKQKLLSN